LYLPALDYAEKREIPLAHLPSKKLRNQTT
jgi:hypothetical protein